ncbi:MAG: GNAT family N-acetyltransferase [Alphaproteobacteria bacterium]|nr:GNAT family N-acetyltransferase [Alphaproteobacteria bacterium]
MPPDPTPALTEPPILTSDRLRLRGHRAEDWPDVTALWADPVVVRHISGTPSTPTESWARLLRYRGLWPLLGYGYWAVEERATGRYLGDLGFADFKRTTTPSIAGIAEAGWAFLPAAHGQGFAREALTLALGWAATHLTTHPSFGGVRALALIATDNHPSHRLAERCGFTVRTTVAWRDETVPLLGWGG